jgi:hypothetical protein
MGKTNRKHNRVPVDYDVVFYWEDTSGRVHNARPRAIDLSESGIRVECSVPIEKGTQLCVDAPRRGSAQEGVVRYCTREGSIFRIGVEFVLSDPGQPQSKSGRGEVDYYEVLQLSSNADLETIRRVYRIMAARFHPDNPESGNKDRFLLLSEAYRVLSDPTLRAQYDLMKGSEQRRPLPLFQGRAFVDEKEGEANRRLGVLCLLYARRRRNPEHPAVGLMELEECMAIPREYLEFTLWYLKQKKYVEMSEGADFCLAATGVDFVEDHTPAQDILVKLLSGGAAKSEPAGFNSQVQ